MNDDDDDDDDADIVPKHVNACHFRYGVEKMTILLVSLRQFWQNVHFLASTVDDILECLKFVRETHFWLPVSTF